MRVPATERVWRHVDKSGGPDACWPFTGYCRKPPENYGVVCVSWKPRTFALAHRLAWESVHGPIPDGMIVLHGCDNPPCCRVGPGHLYLGTDKQNSDDKFRRGRARPARGEHHGSAILTEEQVIRIRSTYVRRSPTTGGAALAREFGVARSTIYAVTGGTNWRYLGATS